MTINIVAETVLDGLIEWMWRGRWHNHFRDVFDDHIHAYCDLYDLADFDELSEKIGQHWGNTLYDMVLLDFLSRETEDGNIVDQYLKRRGWKEKALPKAYIKGIRNSMISLYEVSGIRPGESFLARDLILGGDPILVEERTATRSIAQWENFAMRIVEVRGHNIIAGGWLPYKPELSEKVIDLILRHAEDMRTRTDGLFEEHDENPESELSQDLALGKSLKMSAPLFSDAWLMDTVVDPEDEESRTLVNPEGHSIEFVQLCYSFAKGATQEQLRELLNDAPDMNAASSEIWNWTASRDEMPSSRPNQKGELIYSHVLWGADDDTVVLGSIELKGNTLEGNVNSVERADRLQRRLEDLLGDLVTKPVSVHKTVEQANAEQRNRPAPAKQKVRPPPEIESQIIKDVYDNHYRSALDKPLGMLDNISPRAAVKTPEGKAKVVKWLKILEMHQARSRQSVFYDFTWMWQELGVANLRK